MQMTEYAANVGFRSGDSEAGKSNRTGAGRAVVVYEMAALILSDAECAVLNKMWLALVRRKTNPASSCPNALAWTPKGLNVTGIRDIINTSQIAGLIGRLNTVGILGSTAIIREVAALDRTELIVPVFANYVSLRSSTGSARCT